MYTSFVDEAGAALVPTLGMIFIDAAIEVKEFKTWLSAAWGVPVADIKKGSQKGNRVWEAFVQSNKRTIILRRYTEEGVHYWVVVKIGHVDDGIPESRKRKIVTTMPPNASLVASSSSGTDMATIVTAQANRTPKFEMVESVKYFIRQLEGGCIEEVFAESVSAAANVKPRFRPYQASSSDTPRAEYADYSDESMILTEANRDVRCISWSYRLCLYQYHRCLVEFIDDIDLQKELMRVRTTATPVGFNPITGYNIVAWGRVKERLRSYSHEKRKEFVTKALLNMNYHLEGLLAKEYTT